MIPWLALGLFVSAMPARAQPDSARVAHATLRGWEEQAWLAIFDRGGSYHGRLSDQGILQRFNEKMDSEYGLDLLSFSFSLAEVYEWYQRDNGARYWAGSINHLQLVQRGDFKASVALGAAWSAGVWFTHQRTLQANRSLIALDIRRKLLDDRAQVYLRSTLVAEKPESDIELGFRWSAGPSELTVAVAALDPFSNLIYQRLGVKPPVADTALDYTQRPYTARVSFDLPLGRHLRIEAHGLAMTPTRVVAESLTNPADGFRQDERYGYAGGLLEWAPSARTAVGGFGTWVRARLGRTPLPEGSPSDDFDLTEKTWQLGAYAIHRFTTGFATEAWLARIWRTEERIRPDTSVAANIEYEDRAWAGRANLMYRARSGFRGELGLDFVAREVIGNDELPGQFLDRDHSRLRFDVGWQFGRLAFLVLGSNLDLDGDGRSPNFDGGHARFTVYW